MEGERDELEKCGKAGENLRKRERKLVDLATASQLLQDLAELGTWKGYMLWAGGWA